MVKQVIPAKAGIQVQGSYQAVPDLFEKLLRESLNFLRRRSNWEFFNGLLNYCPKYGGHSTGQEAK